MTIKSQKIQFTGKMNYEGHPVDVVATVRHDDHCGNGHNSFAITGEIYYTDKPRTNRNLIACGCVHDQIKKAIPELEPYIKWHLCSTDEPMHYVANSMYWAKEGNLENARSSAIWPEANLEDFTEEKLLERLPELMRNFEKDVVSLGLKFSKNPSEAA